MGFVFLVCARVRGLGCPACLVVSCGCRKSGERTCLVGSLPAFSFVERMAGLEPAAFTLGGVALSLLSFIRSALPGRSLAFASCALFARVRLFCLRWGAFRPLRWDTCLTYVTPFPQLHLQLPMSSRVVPLSSVMAADALSLLAVMSVT